MIDIINKYKLKEKIFIYIILLSVFFVYLYTMHPVFKNNDSPETTVASITLGIGHPPGYPIFVILAKLFSYNAPGNYAFKINMFSGFLAILVLYITFKILKLLSLKFFNYEYSLLNTFLLLLIAFSFIFWNQAIEAKGGIYILNLLFLSILILYSIKSFYEFNTSYLYFIYFIFSLSLSNHWPSMIILFPVFFYFLFRYINRLKITNYLFILSFFILGLTPYLFLLIRASSDALLNWGNPSDIKSLLWVILRKAYVYPVPLSLKVYLYQTKEYLYFTFWKSNFIFWIFSLYGFFILFKKYKNLFFFFLTIYILIVFFIIFYNRTKEDVLYLMDIFLLPSIYILLLITNIGIIFIFNILKSNIIKQFFLILISGLLITMFLINLPYNNNRKDFFSYDYGTAILNTIDENGVYIGDGDYNLMPVYYLQELMYKRKDIRFFTASFLIFKWGIDYYSKKYGNFDFKPFDTNNNISKLIYKDIKRFDIYRSSFFPRKENIKYNFYETNKGILIKISENKQLFSSKIYELYSYRYLFDNSCLKSKANIDLITWYPVSMVNQANELSENGFIEDAIKLYKMSLNFPVQKPEANIYYNLALAYSRINDTENEIKALENVIKRYPLLSAYEKLGILYYNSFILSEAKKMFEKAIKMGSKNEYVNKGYAYVSKMTYNDMLELAFIKANDMILNNNISGAQKLYNFLLEKNYKNAIIYRNIGVYYFKTGDFEKALRNFNMSKNETYNSEISLYIGYTYFKMQKYNEALNELEQGISKFKDNYELKKLYDEIKYSRMQNEKNFNSIKGQR